VSSSGRGSSTWRELEEGNKDFQQLPNKSSHLAIMMTAIFYVLI
jgi:hypothetical protein